VSKHLAVAQQAVRYTQKVLSKGAGNKFLSNPFTTREIAYTRQALDSGKVLAACPSEEKRIEITAYVAGLSKCGNCEEHTAVAFIYLRDHKVRPIDFMLKGAKHAFVVVGRAKGSKAADPTTWGPEAVVCDPWAGEAYLPSLIQAKMRWFYEAPVKPWSRFRLE